MCIRDSFRSLKVIQHAVSPADRADDDCHNLDDLVDDALFRQTKGGEQADATSFDPGDVRRADWNGDLIRNYFLRIPNGSPHARIAP